MANSGDVVILGRGKDALGFACFIHENTATGQRYVSYEPDVWFLRQRHIQVLEGLGKRVPQDTADTLAVEVP
jgi:hypothetical protein